MAQVTKADLETQIEELEEERAIFRGELFVLRNSIQHWSVMLRSPDHARSCEEVCSQMFAAFQHIEETLNA